jgi:hypothetical protein
MKLIAFLKTLFTDIADLLFNDFTLYRRLSGDDWSLIEARCCPNKPFWVRGIPKPDPNNFTLLSVQTGSTILSNADVTRALAPSHNLLPFRPR